MEIDEFRIRHIIRSLADCAVETSSKTMQDMINKIVAANKENGINENCDIYFAAAICNLMKHTIDTVLKSETFRDIGNMSEEYRRLAIMTLEIAADKFSEEYLGFVKAKGLQSPKEHIKALKAVEIYLTKTNYSEFCEDVYNKLREKEDGL